MRTFYIAGVQFRPGMKEVGKELEVGMNLDLVPEPENEYDPNAIGIHYNGVHLGYVPKRFSSELSALLDVSDLECVIEIIDMTQEPWEQCKVTVQEKEE